MAKIAIMGYGVVGSGVAEVLIKNRELICKNAGEMIDIKYILDLRKFPGDTCENLITDDFNAILNDDEINVVAEVMGGLNPAYEYTKRLLLKGKHVVTSNKELVAEHGANLLRIAKDKGVNYLFEASVGGGIPIIRPINNCLTANKITSIAGILNGTTNYILTKMLKENSDFESALKDAQDKGYAERNPAADIEGHDACRKIAILSSLVFGKRIDYKSIQTKGITDITTDDVEYADKIGCVIKLLASAEIEEEKVYASVEPALIKKNHPLAGVEDVFNGILINGNALGDVMFYGRGAGKLPTASAVVADIIDSVRNIDRNNLYYWEDDKTDFVVPYGQTKARFLVRISGTDSEICGERINIRNDEFGVLLDEMTVDEAEQRLAGIPVIKKLRIL